MRYHTADTAISFYNEGMEEPSAMSRKIILYGHPVCAMVYPVRGMLTRSGVEFEYVDIHQDAEGRARVREINRGYESVPTLVFPDGGTLTEPSSGEINAKLQSLGYDVPLSARIVASLPTIIVGAVVLYALLSFVGII